MPNALSFNPVIPTVRRDPLAPVPTQPLPPPIPTPWGWRSSPRPALTAPQVGTLVRDADLGQRLAAAGAQSIDLRMKGHAAAIEQTGIGWYYGDHSSFKSMTPEAKATWTAANQKPGTQPGTPRESSCIGWAMENVGAAYRAAGKSERWAEIQRTVTARGTKGIDLARELKADGWESVYWNPDARHPNDNNAEHSFSALQVARGRGYYGVAVDHRVENYRPTPEKGTALDLAGIETLSKVPFFFGLAKGGNHTFVGRNGNVNEFHWSQMPNSTTAIEERPLKEWGWNSGLIMVPPGTWPAR